MCKTFFKNFRTQLPYSHQDRDNLEAAADGTSTPDSLEVHFLSQEEQTKQQKERGDTVYFSTFVRLRARFHRATTGIYRCRAD